MFEAFEFGFWKGNLNRISCIRERMFGEGISCKFSLWFRSMGGMLLASGVELPDLLLLLFTIMNRYIWLTLVYSVATHFATLDNSQLVPVYLPLFQFNEAGNVMTVAKHRVCLSVHIFSHSMHVYKGIF
jgi:hypothetical protein